MAKHRYYKSPIDAWIYADDYKIGEMYDEAIMKAVLKVKVDVDKKELLKALEYDRGQYEMGYEQGYIDGKQKWIPVTERLPESDTLVLISVRYRKYNGFIEVAVVDGSYSELDGEWYSENMGGLNADDVLAWQPLPEPYKEENK